MTILMTGRQLELKRESDTFEILRKRVEESKDRSDLSVKSMIEKADDIYGNESAKEKPILEKYQDLYRENSDFAGWITIKGTNIDYPVMQSLGDREYYLHRDFYKKDSYGGVPFVGTGDINKGTERLFLYGHNMKNGTMFADLLKYQDKDYWEKHSYVFLNTLREEHQYRIFAVLRVAEEEWTKDTGLFYQDLGSRISDGSSKIKELKERAIFETFIIPDGKTQLLYLVTCSERQSEERIVIAAERID